jgi:drug/metabolite transporter (DMT)-like permease
MLLLLGGGVMLIVDQGIDGGARLWGLLAVALATAAWGMDNALGRALADRDPSQVVLAKGLLGGAATTLLALMSGQPWPGVGGALALLTVGAVGYGSSLRLYLLAQRAFGAARTGSVFAFAPFVGAAFAVLLGDRSGGPWMLGAAVLMAAGVLLHLTESHDHEHQHDALDHEHAHRHDDGHHDHVHEPMPPGEHSHRHTHAPLRHNHAHVPDLHHRHGH